MKRSVYVFISCFLVLASTHAQVPEPVRNKFFELIRLIRFDSVEQLSTKIYYPLRRPNPLPDISGRKELCNYFHALFDPAFRAKLALVRDSDLFEHHGVYGLAGKLFDGDLWMNQEGYLVAVNHHSASENNLKKQLEDSVKAVMHPSVNSWVSNIYVGRSKKFLLRVDALEKTYRFVCWNANQTFADKPIIIINDGALDFSGTQGGVTYTFRLGDHAYVVDQVDQCEEEKDCGLFLHILVKGNEQYSFRLSESK